jgi:hypothetical protein
MRKVKSPPKVSTGGSGAKARSAKKPKPKAPASPAAPPVTPTWKQISELDGQTWDQPALLRSADGVLHVAWLGKTPAGKPTLFHTAVSSAGALSAKKAMLSDGFEVVQDPALVPTADGRLRVFFCGVPTSETDLLGLDTAVSADGKSWSRDQVSLDSQANGPVGAVPGPAGTPLVCWSRGDGALLVDLGSTRSASYWTGAPAAVAPDLAVDGSTGQIWLGWYSIDPARPGLWAQRVDGASGAPRGAPIALPNGDAVNLPNQRTSIAGRPGRPDVFVAYNGPEPPEGMPSSVVLWRITSGQSSAPLPVTVAQSDLDLDGVGLAPAPDGRLWIFWRVDRVIDDFTAEAVKVQACRSNPTATAFGAPVDAGLPAGAKRGYVLTGDAQAARLDLVGSFGPKSDNVQPTAAWHTQVLPGLTLGASPATVDPKKATAVTFTVTDAGDPVAGATVKVGTKSAKTDANGRASLEVGPPKTNPLAATASATGYAGTTLALPSS